VFISGSIYLSAGSSGSVLEIESLENSPKRLFSPGGRQRPGSDSDILETKASEVSLHHHVGIVPF